MTPLRQRFIEDMQLRKLTTHTQRAYVHYVAGFAQYFGISPDQLDIEAVRQYQLYLLNERKLSPESVNQYISAIRFLYLITLEMPWTNEYFPRVKRPSKLPVVLSQEEVMQFFDNIPSLKYRAALMTCYGADCA
jgi:integrase/recombinase XerD